MPHHKQLLVMRHAKSSWKEPGLTDFERGLNGRGRRVAPQMAQWLEERGLVPDAIFSSSATRAVSTTRLLTETVQGGDSIPVHLLERLFLAPATQYLDLLAEQVDESIDRMMVVGHNPGLEELVFRLSGSFEIMPTAAIAHFDLGRTDWADVHAPFEAELLNLWRPKELGID